MAAEAEAAREARAKVIAAEGEHQASRSLANAAEIITESPAALQVSQYLPQYELHVSIELTSRTVQPIPRTCTYIHYSVPLKESQPGRSQRAIRRFISGQSEPFFFRLSWVGWLARYSGELEKVARGMAAVMLPGGEGITPQEFLSPLRPQSLRFLLRVSRPGGR